MPHTFRDRQLRRRQQVSQASKYLYSEVKLPPFDGKEGKEEWKVWISRFESVAKRRNWDDDTKLDYLLPRLQGRAGDFVFNQLSEEEISCYPTLVKELTSRFHTIETEKFLLQNFLGECKGMTRLPKSMQLNSRGCTQRRINIQIAKLGRRICSTVS